MPAAMQMPGRAGHTHRNAAAFSRHSGFTLIELVIVITIIGLIAAIAYPSYLSQVMKSRRSEATTSLMNAVNNQEQYLLDHKQYTNDMTLLGYSTNPYITPEGMYSIAVTNTGCVVSPCYKFTATPVSGKVQASDTKCATISIDSTGNKTPTECW